MVTALSSTRSVMSVEVEPSWDTAPSEGWSTSLLVTLRRQRSPVRAVWAVVSKRRERGVEKPTGQLWFTVTAFSSRHSPAPNAVGRTMVTPQLPASEAGAPQVTGVGVGLGTGV